MGEPVIAPLPADASVEAIETTYDTCYSWTYEGAREELTNLYEKAKRDQWNGTTQLDWSIQVDPTRELVPDAAITLYGTHLWDRLTPGERERFRWEQLSWSLSQFLHGEQGALLAAAQIVDATPWMEAKYYGATQVVDEARHVEVFHRYLHEKIEKTYPINPHLRSLLDSLLTDGRWDMKYLGMQILVEGLALAAFGFLQMTCNEDLLRELLHYVMKDEARHVAFGVLSLKDYYQDMSASELRDREEFITEGCVLMRDRLLAEEVWEVMGLPHEETRRIVLESPTMVEFRQTLFSKIVPNVKRLGLLTPYVREHFEAIDILKYEDCEASA